MVVDDFETVIPGRGGVPEASLQLHASSAQPASSSSSGPAPAVTAARTSAAEAAGAKTVSFDI